jgi:ADP-ribose pyrophosphatase YjhB (NUDIX family)
MKERSKIIPASYLMLVQDNKILLIRRCNSGYEDGNYSMIAGHVEDGESFTECIIREAKEEAGIVLTKEDLKVVHTMKRKGEKGEDNDRVDVYFTAKKWQGEIKNNVPLKCDDMGWFKLDNLPDNIIPCVKQAIQAIKNKNHYSEFGWE